MPIIPVDLGASERDQRDESGEDLHGCSQDRRVGEICVKSNKKATDYMEKVREQLGKE